jgi:hypothetical protein
MTEQEWLDCADPQPMLEFLRWKASDRKLRLFAVACCRTIWHLLPDECSKQAVTIADLFADGLATREKLAAARIGAEVVVGLGRTAARGAARVAVDDAAHSAWCAYRCAAWSKGKHISSPKAYRAVVSDALKDQTLLLRDTISNPFRPVALDPAWLTPAVVQMAQVIYEDRTFNRLPELADALQESGCDNEEILSHCRQPGEHVRGCWVLDLVLGKE